MGKLRAVLYARVSTDMEAQKSSIEAQTDVDHDYFQKNNYELVKIYADVGESATSANRTEFLEMLHDAGLDWKRGTGQEILFEVNEDREPLFDWIVVKDVSRFTRNIDTLNTIKKLVENNVHINFVDSGFTTKYEDWHMRVTMYLMFAQEESLNTSRKLRNAYYKRAKKGVFHMSVNLMGYDRKRGTDEHYIVEHEAKIIREIFNYYTEDKIGTYEIANRLSDKGYTTRQGSQWSGNAVRRILNNEKYKGQVILNRHGITDITGSARRIIKPKNEWIIYDNAIPPIVSEEQFDKAQKIMADRRVISRTTEGSNKTQFRGRKVIKNQFYKKIWCGKCGADYTRDSATRKNKKGETIRTYYYNCRNRRNRDNKATVKCDGKGIAHNTLKRNLLKIAKNMQHTKFSDEDIIKESIALDNKLAKVDELIKESEKIKSNIDKKISEIDERIKNLLATLSSGVSDTIQKITHEEMERLESKRIKLEDKKISHSVIELENKKQMYRDKYEQIMRLTEKTEYTIEELIEQIHRIEILDDEKVVVSFKTPTLQADDDNAQRLVTYMFTR